MSKRFVIISSPLLLEEGLFEIKKISLDEAKKWVQENAPENFVGHSTVKVLGIEPAKERKTCQGYDEALAIKPNTRLEFGKEYSVEEILEIGVTIFLIKKVDNK